MIIKFKINKPAQIAAINLSAFSCFFKTSPTKLDSPNNFAPPPPPEIIFKNSIIKYKEKI